MAVNSTSNRVAYTGNASTTVFPIPFKFIANGDLRVSYTPSGGTEAIWVLGTNYSLSGADADTGGALTATSAPASGSTLVISRSTTMTQPRVLQSQGPFPPATLTDGLDASVLMTQDVAARTSTLETSVSDMESTIEGGFPTTQYPVEKYGAIGDGVQDDAPGFRAAAAAAANGGAGGVVVMRNNTHYTFKTRIPSWPTQVGLQGQGRYATKITVALGDATLDAITFGAIGTLFSESGAVFSDFTISAPNSNSCRDVLSFTNWNTMEVRDVWVYGGARYGVFMYSVQNHHWKHCTIANAHSAGLFIDGGSPEGVSTVNRFYACSFQDVAHGPGVDFRRCITTEFIDCQFTSNGFSASDTAGVGFLLGTSADANNGSQPTIINPHFEANYGYNLKTNVTPGILTVKLVMVNPLMNNINDKSGSSNGNAYLDGITGGLWLGYTVNDLVGASCRLRIGANTKGLNFYGLEPTDPTKLEYDPGGANDIYRYRGRIEFFNLSTLREEVIGNFDLYMGGGSNTPLLKSQVADAAGAVGWRMRAPNLADAASKIVAWGLTSDLAWIDRWGQLSATAAFLSGDISYTGASIARLLGNMADGASAVAWSVDSPVYANAGAKVMRWRNGTVEKRSFHQSGKDIFPVGGADAVVGSATLAAGLATVATTAVTASSLIFLSRTVIRGPVGNLTISSITDGVGFAISSDSGTDIGDVNWMIIN